MVELLILNFLQDQLLTYDLDLCLIWQQAEYIVLHVVVNLSDDFLGEVGVVAVVVVQDLLLRDEAKKGKGRLRIISLHFFELGK